MKRRGSNKIHDQPSVKKPDVSVSTDLRSKISSKLNTLLNGIQDSSLFIRSRRELYADLLREPQYPEIVIDPTIVVKLEDNETEQCQDAATQFPTENFISSAKSRITELLNKRQDSGKENSVSIPEESIPTSSVKAKTLQSHSYSSKERTKKSLHLESSSTSHSDILISQGQLQNVCVTMEDAMQTRSGTKISHVHLSRSQKSQTCTSSQKPSPRSKKSSLRKSNAKDKQTVIIDKTITSNLLYLDVKDSQPNDSPISDIQSYFLRNSVSNSHSPEVHKHSNCDIIPEVLLTELEYINENVNQDIYKAVNDSEEIDNPEVYFSVDESIVPDLVTLNTEIIPDSNSHDPDVVLVGEKRPTYEVITLEEDDDSAEIIEEVHKCVQCGKTFRARFLLNFHLRMHASHSSGPQIPSSSKLSCSTRSSLRKS